MVPVDIATGFLGCEKTALIKRKQEKGLHDPRVAVIVNDMADVHVNGPVLRGMNVDKMVKSWIPGVVNHKYLYTPFVVSPSTRRSP